jgi:P2-related tail formation protein
MTQQSFTLHQHQGTIYALRQSLEPLDYRLTLQEWWQTQDPPGTFRLHIDVGSEGISQAQRHEIEHLIDLAKPASRHVLSLTIGLETHGQVTYGFTCQTGDLLTIFPLTAQGVTVTGKARLGGALHVFDTLGILS